MQQTFKPLPLHVFRAHIHGSAGKSEPSGDRRCCNSMLPRARLRDHAFLAHADGQQPLSNAIIDLVCAGVEQIFTFNVDSGAAEMLRQPRRKL